MPKTKAKSTAKRSAATGKFVLGRSAYEKVAAVEGIATSRKLKREFRKFDAEKTPASERRAALKKTYSKQR